MTYFNEYALEMAIMELFEKEGYIYTSGDDIHKVLSDVLLRDDLRAYLRDRYAEQGITSLEVESVIARLTANMGGLLYENNVHTYRLITEGFSIKREDASKADLFIEPIDFSAEANNIIRIVNQLEVKGLEKRISDLKGNYCSELSEMFHFSKPTYYEIEELLESCTPCTFVYDENIQPMYEFSIFGKMEDFLRKKDVYKVKNKE